MTSASFTSAVMTPRLSIIIATRQASATLERCLTSIIEQSFTEWEILIADSASTDGTLEIISRFGRFIAWWQSRRDDGIADAWNQALPHARGEYVTFLGADDRWHSASTLSRIFQKVGDGEYDLVTGRGNLIDARGRRFQFGGPWDFKKVTRRITICHPGCLHRRDLFTRFGLFNTSYRIAADYDLILRLPSNIRTLHLEMPFVDVGDGGVSRQSRWLTLQERFSVQTRCPRVGRLRAGLNFVDKLWRIPVAKALGIPN